MRTGEAKTPPHPCTSQSERRFTSEGGGRLHDTRWGWIGRLNLLSSSPGPPRPRTRPKSGLGCTGGRAREPPRREPRGTAAPASLPPCSQMPRPRSCICFAHSRARRCSRPALLAPGSHPPVLADLRAPTPLHSLRRLRAHMPPPALCSASHPPVLADAPAPHSLHRCRCLHARRCPPRTFTSSLPPVPRI